MKKILLLTFTCLISIALFAQHGHRHDDTYRYIRTNIFGDLEYKDSDREAKLKKDIFDNMIYSDSRGNEVKYSKEHWSDILKDFRGDKEKCFVWLIHEYRGQENQKKEFSKNIFGDDVYKGNNGYTETFKRDIFDNYIFENNRGQKAKLESNIFDRWIYSDSEGTKHEFSEREWSRLLKRYASENAIFRVLVADYLFSE